MDIWNVIDVYYKSNTHYLTRHHIDSYNDFVLSKIPYTVETLNPFIIVKDDSKYRVEIHIDDNVRIEMPKYDEDQIMYPNVARLKDDNYIANLVSDVKITYFYENEIKNEVSFKDKKIGSVPILLHSKICYLYGLDSTKLNHLGECPFDQGGYFIIDGKEKVIISQERIATNQLFLSDTKEPELYKLEGMIRSTSIVNNLFPKTVKFWVCNDRNVNDNEFFVRMNVMNINIEKIPIFIIFRALGIESDKDIIDYICLDDDYLTKHLRPSIIDALHENEYTIYSSQAALQYLSNFVKHKDIDFVKYIFINDLFPNIGNDFRQKAMYLGYLINKLIKTTIGVIKRNERDNYMYKRVDTTGILLGNIFRDFYNQFRNNVRNSIDREYTLGGSNKFDLVSEANFRKIFNSTIISDGMYKSMKGNWGLTGDPSEQGIVQDVSRISYISYVSHLRRVNTPIDRSIKLVAPHRLDSPQYGMMCPIESPDGSNIGLLKHMSATCEITLESSRDDILKCLTELGVIFLEFVNPYSTKNSTKVFLNNNWIGIHKTPKELHDQMLNYRRLGVLTTFVSISWNIQENDIMIFCDSGRCCRPLIIAEQLKSMNYSLDHWNKYINGYTYDYTFDKKQKKEMPYLEYLDTYETNFKYIAMKHEDVNKYHTHVEIHPCLSLSMYTNSIPFANHNQAPRNVFSGQQGKQAIGVYATNFNHRIDTASYLLHYPQRSLVTTKMAKYIYKNNLPNGENLIVAICTYTGYNQEDSVIVNKSSIERGMFNISYMKAITDTEDENKFTNEYIKFDNPITLRNQGYAIETKQANYSKINEQGFPIEDEYITTNDCYIGKLNVQSKPVKNAEDVIFNDEIVQKVYKDKSKIADKTISGKVDKVLVYTKDDYKKTKIKLRKFRIPELGDKMASSHGQKGVCGMVIPQENMPFNKNGLVPDIIINPHAIPTRMTIGHLVECVLAKLCCVEGKYIDATPFEQNCIPQYYDILSKYNYQKHGDEILYNGFTGDQIETEIFIGPTYYLRLKHMVKDKINYRAGGPIELTTRQPTQGRSNGGGLRIGEMENNAILGHGIASFIKESMTKRSDEYHMYIDEQSGEDVIYNERENQFSSLFSKKIQIPYSMKMLKQEVAALGVDMKLHTKNILDN